MALEKILKNSSGIPTGEYERISGGTLYADTPVGVIQSFGGSAIPTGWLLCDGAEVLKTDYVELYAVIGDAFGTASVNTKFVLPDLREATTKGAGETGKTVGAHVKSGGLAVGEFLDDRVQEHSHTFGSADNQVGLSDYSAYYKGTALSTGTGNKFNTGSNSGRTGATTEVKSVGVNYIIKAKQVALPADLESAVEDAVEEMCTDTVTSGSTAPITSGGVYDRISDFNTVSASISATLRGQIKATADSVSDYSVFSGQSQADIEGGWFGFKKTANFWHCLVYGGNGAIYKLTYSSGTYTEKFFMV